MPDLERITAYPPLDGLTEADRRTFLAGATAVSVPKGTEVFAVGAPCNSYLKVITGVVKVSQIAENGREIVLYRVGDGETCIITTNCLISHADYPAEGIAETDIEAVALSAPAFHQLMADSAHFRDFVLASYADRIADLLLLVEEVVSRKTDCRLANCLVNRVDPDGTVTASHRELAAELGTAREVVSRQLKEFERRGWLTLDRGSLTLHDRDALAALAAI